MGIRCECPCGYRLNVKEALAGKRGVCPECGATVVIPALPAASPDTPASPKKIASSAAAPAMAATPAAKPRRPSPARAVPKAPAEPPAPAPEQTAEWYARPPGGEQLGPATAEVLREWLSSGVVTSESYVWRTGWPDWKRVDQATADLPTAPPPPPPVVGVQEAAPAVAPSVKQPPSAAVRYARRRRRAGQRQVFGVLFLAVLATVLGGVLYWVLVKPPVPTVPAAESPVAEPEAEVAPEPAEREAPPADDPPFDASPANADPFAEAESADAPF